MPDNDFGYTRWGMDWVRLAEPLKLSKPEPLLPRARSVARNVAPQLEISGTTVRAHLHRGSEASVIHLEFAPLGRATVEALNELIPPGTLTLSDELRAAVSDAGITVTPRLVASDCSCRARNDRCLHVIVLLYTLAQRVDENPWLALDLQGYRSGGAPDAETKATVAPPRWTPIDVLDPAAFFGG
ncbi:SWIM zinc finger family protein [Nocardia yamanashiensis]|uniref:SWIM zinc finger family protein n=1 Tax=Nocardia yamanashiensis TaxID=209247 RepID=UPI001E40D254|nr:SWIM zinc finger family protein [Nocardia yamanashiensis]UGT42651.1 SWIM zinc finger family protein [Nocardia yamanashiensis]